MSSRSRSPRQVEFLRGLRKTRIDKIDYRALVQQHITRHQPAGQGVDAT